MTDIAHIVSKVEWCSFKKKQVLVANDVIQLLIQVIHLKDSLIQDKTRQVFFDPHTIFTFLSGTHKHKRKLV